jgi:hypothetical protein
MDLPQSPTLRFVAVLLLASCWASGADDLSALTSPSPTQAPSVREDELWLVSTRHLCFPDWNDPSSYDLDVRRYNPTVGWQTSSLVEFLAGPSRLTVVYVHANRTNWSDAIELGHVAYQSLVSCAGNGPLMRFVIWSWPSDQVHGPLRDLRSKAERADCDGSFFGWFLSQLPPGTSVGVVGFSYGARIISGGLQLLSGGMLNGHTLPDSRSGEPLHIRAVYLAAAMDRDWLYPSGYHGQSLSQVERLLITYNGCDPALKRFRFVDPCTRATALGFTGIYAGGLGEAANRVEQLDVASWVGKTHDQLQYWYSSVILGEICRIMFEGISSNVGDIDNTAAIDVGRAIVPVTAADTGESNADASNAVAPVLQNELSSESDSEHYQQNSSGEADHRFQRSGRLLRRRR